MLSAVSRGDRILPAFAKGGLSRKATRALVEARRRLFHVRKALEACPRMYAGDDLMDVVRKQVAVLSPTETLRMMTDVRLPYDPMWIEWDGHHFYRDTLTAGTPKKMGFLLRGEGDGLITALPCCWAESYSGDDPLIMPFDTTIAVGNHGHVPAIMRQQLYEMIEAVGVPEEDQSRVLLGAAIGPRWAERVLNDLGAGLKEGEYDEGFVCLQTQDLGALERRMSLTSGAPTFPLLLAACQHRGMDRGAVASMMNENGGDGRLSLIILHLLMHHTLVADKRSTVGARTGSNRKRASRSVEYHRLSLKLPRDTVLARLAEPPKGVRGGGRKRHPVMGHWCVSRKRGDRFCDHDWQEYDGPKRQVCVRCSGFRWWRDDCHRGDASLGTIRTDYELHAA